MEISENLFAIGKYFYCMRQDLW